MVDFLIHIYKKGGEPFRSLSALPQEEALAMMEALYVRGSVFWERFENPAGYLQMRREVERELREAFVEKGGRPAERHPVYFMLGRPPWTVGAADEVTLATTEEIVVPLSLFEDTEVSFTYPDSMVSALMVQQKNPAYYEPDYHGHLFTLAEIRAVVAERGMPGEGWKTRMPSHLAHYIEAQVWNRTPLDALLAERRRAEGL